MSAAWAIVARFAGRSWQVAKAVWAFAKKRCPKWLVPVMAVCLVIPGPLDEMLVLAVVAYPVLRSREARSELAGMIRLAWTGSDKKSGAA